MTIVFIAIMALGLVAFIASFVVKFETEEETKSLNFVKEEPKAEFKKEPVIEESNANDAIEAAKKKAREAVNKEYKFDLHLNKDTSNQTVEELEKDLLGGLDLSDTEPVSEVTMEEPAAKSSNYSGSKKKNRKKNTVKNDRYDDLNFEDPAETVETKTEEGKNSNQKSQSSKNNKKGKKK